ncbi:MAG: hypothetical protein F6K21_04275 [Symploca sp. SIO2D2]|nr:hypothetical protein [Symploca sp. SIO2D2]
MKISLNSKTFLKIFKTGAFWYWLNAFLVFIYWRVTEVLKLVDAPDSGTYSSFGEIYTMLSSARTLGYPLFIQAVSVISPDLSILPTVQFFIYAIAAFVFFVSLRIYGFSQLQALIITCPLFYLQFPQTYIPYLLTESLAVSFAMLTIAFLILVVSKPKNILLWLGLSVTLFYTYQIRPAFLFLIPLIPLLGLALFVIKYNYLNWHQRYSKILLQLLATSIIPLLLFSTFRFFIVGQFGLVSFGGFNIMGIASQMLTEDLLPSLSLENQKIANLIIEKRDNDRKILSEPEKHSEHPLLVHNVPIECTKPLPMHYPNWVNCYNYHIWLLSTPIVADLENYGNIIAVNEAFKSISQEIIVHRPRLYLQWLKEAFNQGIIGTATIDKLVFWSSNIFLGILSINIFLLIFNQLTKNKPYVLKYSLLSVAVLSGIILLKRFLPLILGFLLNFGVVASFSGVTIINLGVFYKYLWQKENINSLIVNTSVFAIVAFSYFLSGLILVILVEPPIPRYLGAKSIFLASSLFLFSYTATVYTIKQVRR